MPRGEKEWLWQLIAVAGVVIAGFGIYRASIADRAPDVPPIAPENSIHITEAVEHIGQERWVHGVVDHVFVSENDNHFINFCSNFGNCPFSAVIFAYDADRFDDPESWSGKNVHLYGAVSMYEGRPQIIIEYPVQVHVGVEEETLGAGGMVEVMAVVDGDTIRVRMNNGVSESVRLIGIDTPEVKGPHTEKECFGPEASMRTAELLRGGSVMLVPDPLTAERDEYDRLLRYVFTEDGRHVNAVLVEEGFASYFPFESFAYMDEFAGLEARSKADGLGQWGAACG